MTRKRKRRKRFRFLKFLLGLFFIFVLVNFLKTRYNETAYYDGDFIDKVESLFSFNFAKKDYKTDDKNILLRNIKKEADKGNDKARWLYENSESLNDTLLYLAGNDSDTIEFVYNYKNAITDFSYFDGSSHDFSRKTPYFLQWDNRWAYKALGNSVIGLAGCGPTSMAMILSRLNNDITINPEKISNDARNYMTNEGISWKFFSDEANKYGYQISDISIDENSMINALNSGPLLVSVNRGIFTLFGHIIVIDSYKDGKFIVNDPNSIKKSEKAWSYDEICDQIAHVWLIN